MITINDFNFLIEQEGNRLSQSKFQLNEGFSTLYEDMFSGGKNSSELKKVDRYFDEILELVEKKRGSLDNKSQVSSLLKNINNIVNKMFNIQMNMYIDYDRKNVENIAYTYLRKEIIEVLESDVKEIVMNEKTGYHMIQPRSVEVVFEDVGMKYLKYPELSGNGGNKGKEIPAELGKFEGRHMTSILLHEIGHNIFIPFYFNQNNKGNYEIQIKNQKPIIVYPDTFGKKEAMMSFITFVAVNTITLLIYPMLLPYTIVGFLGRGLEKYGISEYMRNEKNANTLPVQYGYIDEVLENTIRIKWLSDVGSIPTIYAKIRALVGMKKRVNKKEYQSIITRDILTIIDIELKNSNNTKEQIDYLKAARSNYVDGIRHMQSEIDIYTGYA